MKRDVRGFLAAVVLPGVVIGSGIYGWDRLHAGPAARSPQQIQQEQNVLIHQQTCQALWDQHLALWQRDCG